MRRGWTLVSGPLPSIGSPSVLTTRPSRPSPTGTERISPVALTVWPSSMRVDLAEHHGADRLLVEVQGQAEQCRDSNSSSSFTAASGRPDTRAMPSPTSTTRPTWVSATSGVKPSRFLLDRGGDVGGVDGQLGHVGWFSCRRSRSGRSVLRQKASRSWFRRVRTEPSMTESPIWVTMPPMTDGSTMLRTVTCRVGLGRQRCGEAGQLVVGERRRPSGPRPRPRRRLGAERCDDLVGDLRRGRRRGRRPTTIDTSATVRRRRLAVEQVLDDLLAALDRAGGGRSAWCAARRWPRRTRPKRNSSSSTSATLPSAERDREHGVGVGGDAGSVMVSHSASVRAVPTWLM